MFENGFFYGGKWGGGSYANGVGDVAVIEYKVYRQVGGEGKARMLMTVGNCSIAFVVQMVRISYQMSGVRSKCFVSTY